MNYQSKAITKVLILEIIFIFLSSLGKFAVGIFIQSSAMISDAFHTLTEAISTIMVIVGVKLSQKEEDEEYPYGYDKVESVISIILACIIFATGFTIFSRGVNNYFDPNQREFQLIPTLIYFGIAIFSIISQEYAFRYNKKIGEELNSSALLTDAWSHRSGSITTFGSVIGVIGIILGFPILDLIATILISAFTIKISIDVIKRAADQLMDKAIDNETLDIIKKAIISTDKVLSLDTIKTRKYGRTIHIEAEISVDSLLTVRETSYIILELNYKVKKAKSDVTDFFVQVNPY